MENPTPKGPKRKPGEPVRPDAAGVLKRAGLIAAGYTLVLIFLIHTGVVLGIAIGLLGFAIMVPMGLLIDRWRYKRQMRTWAASRAGAK